MGIKKVRSGQALIELAVGMFTIALVVSLLCGFAVYIAKSLRAQNTLRTGNGGSHSRSDTVEVGEFAAKYLFGLEVLKVKEKVVMPTTSILR